MAYTKKEQPGIMLYWSAFDALEEMVDGEAKQMLRAMRQYAYYCLATPKGKMIAGQADYTGMVPKWCPLGDGALHD